jgi:hypothetical protein
VSNLLREYSICRVASVAAVDVKTAAKTVLFPVPSGKVFYPALVVVRDPSASMAGGTEYDFGVGADATGWVQNVDLSSLTTLGTDYYIISGLSAKFTECAALSEFGVKVITGTTAACTATFDVFGFVV